MDNKAQWSLVAAAWVLAIGVISLGIFAIRHFSQQREAALPGQLQSFGTAARPLCPVDRIEVISSPETPHATFNGNIYYFCENKDLMGRSHKALFLMDPLLYLTGVSGHSSPVPTPAATAPEPQAPAPANGKTVTPTPSPTARVRTETGVFGR